MSHWCSCEITIQAKMNDERHAALNHAFNCVSLCRDMVHGVEISNIGNGRAWEFLLSIMVRDRHFRFVSRSNPTRHSRYVSIKISQPVWNWHNVSGSSYRFLSVSWFCGLIIVSYRNVVIYSRWFVFAWLVLCDMDLFGMCVIHLIYRIFACNGGHYFCNMLEYLCDALTTKDGKPMIVATPLTLIFRMPQGVCWCCLCPKCCQNHISGRLQPIRTSMTRDAKLDIVASPLTSVCNGSGLSLRVRVLVRM